MIDESHENVHFWYRSLEWSVQSVPCNSQVKTGVCQSATKTWDISIAQASRMASSAANTGGWNLLSLLQKAKALTHTKPVVWYLRLDMLPSGNVIYMLRFTSNKIYPQIIPFEANDIPNLLDCQFEYKCQSRLERYALLLLDKNMKVQSPSTVPVFMSLGN